MDYQPVKLDNIIFKRKRRGKFLLCSILVALLILLVIALGVYVFVLKDRGICKTPQCVEASKTIVGNMDMKVDPCQDFYKFACGNFLNKTVIPSSKTLVDSFSTLTNVIDKQIHTVLEEPYNKDDTKSIHIVKKVYKSCMNETDIELNSLRTIKNLLRRFGGWPVIEGARWNEASFNWIETLLKMKDSGLPYGILMDFAVELDDKNSSRRILTVDQPFIPFEPLKRGPRNNPILDATHTFMVNLAEEFGANRNTANREMENVLNFEMAIAKIMVPQEERRNLEDEYNPMSIRDLERNYPIVPWYSFINRLVFPAKVTYDTNLVIYIPEYLRRLKEIVDKTSRRLLANYILYKAAGSMLTYSNKKLRQIQLEFTKATVGVQSSTPRNELCTSIASRLDIATGALYVRKYFNKESKVDTEEIVKDIEDQFSKTLNVIDWMDQDTKNAALEKLRHMDKYIAYPDELMDDTKLEGYYKDLHLTNDNFLEIVLNVSKFQTEKDMMQLSEPVIRSDWRTRSSVAIVNAFYDLNANAIQVPAGILQGVFFNAKRPRYLNFGGIGYIIGHEFTHGFDDEGSQMDQDGNLKEWWKGSTKTAYEEKAKCIVDQYSNITVPEVAMKINGINCQGENIADNGGIKLAYLAYQEWVNKNKEEEKLPDLDYSPNQMFWIGAANVWCSKITTKAMEQEILTEVHPPDKYRINIPFANSEYFSKDFNCAKGTPMNPIQTCSVWYPFNLFSTPRWTRAVHLKNRRMLTKLEQVLIGTIVFLILLVFSILFIVHFGFGVRDERICMSPSCMKTSLSILESLDHNVDPCDDFYMFVCGNYLKNNFIPDDKTEISSFSEVEDSLSHKMRILLEEPEEMNEIRPFRFIKTQYKTCVNSSQDNTDTLKYLLRQVGGWPVLEGENWGDRYFDWRELVHRLRKAGLYSEIFLVINAEIMMSNSSQRILEVDEPMIICREYLKNGLGDKITKAMYELMVDIAVLLGADRQRAEEEMGRVINFLVELAQIAVSPEEKRASSSLNNLMTVNDLELTFPIVKWESYINNQLLGLTRVEKNTTMNVLHPKHLKKLNALILHNEKRTIANYIMWMVVFFEIQYSNQQLRDRLNEFSKIAEGNTQNIPVWKNCVDDVTYGLPLVAGSLYVRRFFKKEAKENMLELVDLILQQFKRELLGLQWMEEDSKKRALLKADSITAFIGYPDELLDNNKMVEHFADLGIPPENYLLLDLRLRNFTIKAHYRFLLEGVDKKDWRKQHSPIDVNAFYESSSNSIHFPAGILQDNFFDHEGPNYVNFGRIGFLIGHEITHGFDDEGRLFDENGNMVDWWSEKTKNAFMENAMCIVEQYSNNTVPEVNIKINGANSQGENIADNGGIKQAYLAYTRWLSNHGPDKYLPGLSFYTDRQMFWIASASSWCSKTRPERLKTMLLSDEHVPIYYRINIPLANSEYFAEDFKCPLESKMNPITKCKVW
ncbi:uncharacterized protein LOC123310736 [Coccinella septempunctata]|uniref:uncharacterized protein LOC123310736 n=1 Tax=Coccinella septempunctata TaxID=41139 RepID=UPI001D09121A|nr:uncharacterized protein LOC123310736 [Coccinella septempunctata]